MDLMSTLVDLLDRLQARPMWPDSELTKPSAGIATTADRRAISGEDVPSRNNRETPTTQCEWPHTEGHCNGQLYAPHRSPLGGGSHTEGQDIPNSTHFPIRITAPQVMIVSPLSSYYLKGQLAGQHSKILVDTGSPLSRQTSGSIWMHWASPQLWNNYTLNSSWQSPAVTAWHSLYTPQVRWKSLPSWSDCGWQYNSNSELTL